MSHIYHIIIYDAVSSHRERCLVVESSVRHAVVCANLRSDDRAGQVTLANNLIFCQDSMMSMCLHDVLNIISSTINYTCRHTT